MLRKYKKILCTTITIIILFALYTVNKIAFFHIFLSSIFIPFQISIYKLFSAILFVKNSTISILSININVNTDIYGEYYIFY